MSQQFGNGFESLEDRTLLAANVTATLVDGTLTITGDDSANDVEVNGTGAKGAVEVSLGNGQSLGVTGGTTVDAHDGKFTGVTNIVINNGSGNDTVNVTDVNLKGSLTATGGVGVDSTTIDGLTLGKRLSLVGGSGNGDTTDVTDLNIKGNLNATEGAGTGDALSLSNLNVKYNVNVSGGGGANDTINLAANAQFNSYIGGHVDLNAGTGANTSVNVDESGASTLGIGGKLTATGTDIDVAASGNGGSLSVGGNVELNVDSVAGGTGAGMISSTGTATVGLGGNVVINGGAGNDTLELNAHGGAYGFGINQTLHGLSVAGNVTINAGTGNDTIGIQALGQQATSGDDSALHGFGFNSETVAIGGNVSLNGSGTGHDNLDVHASGANIDIAGNLSMTGASGGDTFDMTAYGAYTGLPHETLINSQIDVGKALTVTGGAGINDIAAVNLTVAGNSSILGGNSNDEFDLLNDTFDEAVGLVGMAGKDVFNLEDNLFNNNLTIQGNSKDTLNLAPDNTILGTTSVIGITV